MTQREKFLRTSTYEEYEAIKDELKELDFKDLEIHNHLKALFLKAGVRFNVKEAKEGVTLDYFKKAEQEEHNGER